MRPYTFLHCGPEDYAAELRTDARTGFTAPQRFLSARWCFDGRGRRLFRLLTAGPGDHLVNNETTLISRSAQQIADLTDVRHFIHIGSTSWWHTDPLVRELRRRGLSGIAVCDTPHGSLDWHMPSVVYGDRGVQAHHLIAALPGMVPPLPGSRGRLLSVPSIMLATLQPLERVRLFTGLRRRCRPGDRLLLAAPTRGALPAMARMFDTDAGAEFNRNALNVVNHTLDCEVDATDGTFQHRVTLRTDGTRLDLSLRSRGFTRLELRTLGFHSDLAPGDELRTLRLSSLAPEELAVELAETGFAPVRHWTDPHETVTATLAEPVASPHVPTQETGQSIEGARPVRNRFHDIDGGG